MATLAFRFVDAGRLCSTGQAGDRNAVERRSIGAASLRERPLRDCLPAHTAPNESDPLTQDDRIAQRLCAPADCPEVQQQADSGTENSVRALMEHEITTARQWRAAYSLVFSLMVAVVVVLGFFFTRPPV